MATQADGVLDADPMVLARGTPGFSGADLQNMVKYVKSRMLTVKRSYRFPVKLRSKRQKKVHVRSV
jgi:hypothetical protein